MDEKRKKFWLTIAASLVGAALIFGTEPSYRQSLFQKSLEKEPTVQAGMSTFGTQFWEFWTSFGLAFISVAPIGIPLVSLRFRGDKARAVYYALVMTGVLFLSNTTKTSYHQARPFWDNA